MSSAPVVNETHRQTAAGHIFENHDTTPSSSTTTTDSAQSTTTSNPTIQSAKETASNAYESAKEMATSAYNTVKDAVLGNNPADDEDEIGVLG